jgi:hypothetical protein
MLRALQIFWGLTLYQATFAWEVAQGIRNLTQKVIT